MISLRNSSRETEHCRSVSKQSGVSKQWFGKLELIKGGNFLLFPVFRPPHTSHVESRPPGLMHLRRGAFGGPSLAGLTAWPAPTPHTHPIPPRPINIKPYRPKICSRASCCCCCTRVNVLGTIVRCGRRAQIAGCGIGSRHRLSLDHCAAKQARLVARSLLVGLNLSGPTQAWLGQTQWPGCRKLRSEAPGGTPPRPTRGSTSAYPRARADAAAARAAAAAASRATAAAIPAGARRGNGRRSARRS